MTSREGGRKKRSFVGLRKDAGNEKKKKREKEDDDEKKKILGWIQAIIELVHNYV